MEQYYYIRFSKWHWQSIFDFANPFRIAIRLASFDIHLQREPLLAATFDSYAVKFPLRASSLLGEL